MCQELPRKVTYSHVLGIRKRSSSETVILLPQDPNKVHILCLVDITQVFKNL